MAVRTERSDKWVRGYVGDVAVVDSREPLLFWEEEFPVPAYAFPRGDVRTDLLSEARDDPPEDVAGSVFTTSDLGRHAAHLHDLVGLGFDRVFLHHVGQEQRPFLDAFGEAVLPELDVTAPAPRVAAP